MKIVKKITKKYAKQIVKWYLIGLLPANIGVGTINSAILTSNAQVSTFSALPKLVMNRGVANFITYGVGTTVTRRLENVYGFSEIQIGKVFNSKKLIQNGEHKVDEVKEKIKSEKRKVLNQLSVSYVFTDLAEESQGL
ncbi:hypothetical protein FACS1894192_08150 [Bacilli bacterium]|nr:hypothetical protein FACS1894192_08150 [Bacilli bacterium]